MDWVKSFYSKTGKWWGPAEVKITDRDYQRLAIVKRLAGKTPKSVLELGASYGNTAAVFADAGIDIIGLEISDRADFAKQHTSKQHNGSLKIIKEDFYIAQLSQKFEVICYWNGFGIGEDKDQKKLLKRIAKEWLEKDGSLIMDVQNPYIWQKWDGDEEHKKAKPEEGYNYNISQKIKYDSLKKRMYDTWWETDKPEERFIQTIRCYTPKELISLIKNTGLKIVHMEVKEKEIDWHKKIPKSHPFWETHEYLVQLKFI